MLLQGFTLTIVGMSVVFTFLTIMVFVMKIMSAFLPKYFPDVTANKQIKVSKQKKEAISESMKIAEVAPMGEVEIAAVIAAVKSYSYS